jgi:hypothetical protein
MVREVGKPIAQVSGHRLDMVRGSDDPGTHGRPFPSAMDSFELGEQPDIRCLPRLGPACSGRGDGANAELAEGDTRRPADASENAD